MEKYGVGNDNLVVLYSTPGQWAARVWWMLRSFGFDNAVILSGGLPKWTAEGRPVSNESCTYTPGTFKAKTHPEAFVGKDDVLAAINDGANRINQQVEKSLDQRSPVAGDLDIGFGQVLEDRKHQFLFAQARGVLDTVLFGDREEFLGGFLLEFFEVHLFVSVD